MVGGPKNLFVVGALATAQLPLNHLSQSVRLRLDLNNDPAITTDAGHYNIVGARLLLVTLKLPSDAT